MTDKICLNCKWLRPREKRQPVCYNPMNDHLFDFFNTSTGEIMPNIRIAATTENENTCVYFESFKEKKDGKKADKE